MPDRRGGEPSFEDQCTSTASGTPGIPTSQSNPPHLSEHQIYCLGFGCQTSKKFRQFGADVLLPGVLECQRLRGGPELRLGSRGHPHRGHRRALRHLGRAWHRRGNLHHIARASKLRKVRCETGLGEQLGNSAKNVAPGQQKCCSASASPIASNVKLSIL